MAPGFQATQQLPGDDVKKISLLGSVNALVSGGSASVPHSLGDGRRHPMLSVVQWFGSVSVWNPRSHRSPVTVSHAVAWSQV